MRNSYYYGHTIGAKVTELRRGSVNSVSIGRIEHNPLIDAIKLHPCCQLTGKSAKALAATLSEIRITSLRDEITPAERAAQFDAAITSRMPSGLS
jgi:hypothetical protein